MFFMRSFTSRPAVSLLAVLCLFGQQCRAGYLIQPDCSAEQRTVLEEAFSNIVDLVEVAKRYNTAETSDAGKELFQRLFGEQPGSGMMSQSVSQTLDGVAANAHQITENPQGGDSTTADVLVHCTTERLITKTGPDGDEVMWDPSIRHWLKAKFDCGTATAFLSVPHHDLTQPDVLQVCPWFLEYLMSIDLRYQSKWDQTKFRKLVKFMGTKMMGWIYAEIDLFRLPEKVLTHELTHSRRGGQRDDPRGIAGYKSYGWKNCREMSTNRNVKDAPQNNADTYAIFVSAASVIEDGGQIDQDGKLSVAPAPQKLKNKRSVRFNAASLKGRALF